MKVLHTHSTNIFTYTPFWFNYNVSMLFTLLVKINSPGKGLKETKIADNE